MIPNEVLGLCPAAAQLILIRRWRVQSDVRLAVQQFLLNDFRVLSFVIEFISTESEHNEMIWGC
jgi:hypothetical protein